MRKPSFLSLRFESGNDDSPGKELALYVDFNINYHLRLENVFRVKIWYYLKWQNINQKRSRNCWRGIWIFDHSWTNDGQMKPIIVYCLIPEQVLTSSSLGTWAITVRPSKRSQYWIDTSIKCQPTIILHCFRNNEFKSNLNQFIPHKSNQPKHRTLKILQNEIHISMMLIDF